jgi:hypothetical protein
MQCCTVAHVRNKHSSASQCSVSVYVREIDGEFPCNASYSFSQIWGFACSQYLLVLYLISQRRSIHFKLISRNYFSSISILVSSVLPRFHFSFFRFYFLTSWFLWFVNYFFYFYLIFPSLIFLPFFFLYSAFVAFLSFLLLPFSPPFTFFIIYRSFLQATCSFLSSPLVGNSSDLPLSSDVPTCSLKQWRWLYIHFSVQVMLESAVCLQMNRSVSWT